MKHLAPIALFVYDRIHHTQLAIEALQNNNLASETNIYIFSDAPKNEELHEAVRNVREYIKSIDGFNSVTIFESETNLGLANSIINGVSWLCNEFGRVIVVEDDLVTSPFFLQYMNEALDIYADEPMVGSIHGYCYPINLPITTSTFFIRGASCWGWATWRRAWNLFEEDGNKLLHELTDRKLTLEFDFEGAAEYTKMLKNQILGKNNSWAIRWHASMFLRGMLQLTPNGSLVKNIGFDGSGTHSNQTSAYDNEVVNTLLEISEIPVQECLVAKNSLYLFHKRTKRSIKRKILDKLKTVVSP